MNGVARRWVPPAPETCPSLYLSTVRTLRPRILYSAPSKVSPTVGSRTSTNTYWFLFDCFHLGLCLLLVLEKPWREDWHGNQTVVGKSVVDEIGFFFFFLPDSPASMILDSL